MDTWQKCPITRYKAFFDNKLWSKQEEVLQAIRKYPKVAVKSGNTVGKSFLAAQVVLDYLTVNYPAKVVTTAPTWSQVEKILWKEIAGAYRKSKIPFGGDLLNTELKIKEDHFAFGLSTDSVHRFQGIHSPHLLVVIDEASGVLPEIYEAVEALHPHKVLAIGNPLDPSGNFFDIFSNPYWHKITISCLEAIKWQKENGSIPGLVTQAWVDEVAYTHGVKSPYYQAHVLGEFPEQGEGSLIARSWVDVARKTKSEDQEDDETRIISCDVATKHGNNETVIGYRYGHTYKSLTGYKQIPVNQTADLLSVEFNKRRAHAVVIDSDGIGEGLSDFTASRNLPTIEFHGGYTHEANDSARFRNLRTQFYWIVAKKFEKGMYDLSQLDDKSFEILKNQLCCIKVKKSDGMGRLQIETKDDLHARGIMSPDYADAFVYGEYGFYCGKFSDIKPYKY